MLWCHQESNRGPRPEFDSPQSFALSYQSFALSYKKTTQAKPKSFSVVPPGIEPWTQGQNLTALSPLLYHTKNDPSIYLSRLRWCHQESNRGHKDFQSFALPTELWHQVAFSSVSALCCRCGLFASAKVRQLLRPCKKMRELFGVFYTL